MKCTRKPFGFPPENPLPEGGKSLKPERVGRITGEDKKKVVENDPDAAPLLDESFWRNVAFVQSNEKTSVLLPLDSDIVEFFERRARGNNRA